MILFDDFSCIFLITFVPFVLIARVFSTNLDVSHLHHSFNKPTTAVLQNCYYFRCDLLSTNDQSVYDCSISFVPPITTIKVVLGMLKSCLETESYFFSFCLCQGCIVRKQYSFMLLQTLLFWSKSSMY